MKSNEY